MGHLIANIIEWTLKLLNRGGDEIARGSEELINNADQLAGDTIRASSSINKFFGLLYQNWPHVTAWVFTTLIIAIFIYILIMLVARNKESPLLHISSVILPVMWILASLIFGYNSLMAKNENYDGFKSAENNQKGILEFRKEVFNDIMSKKGSGALKSIEYIDDRELMLRHIYVSTCFRSLLKNYERFEKFKNTNINEAFDAFSLGNINRFRGQKLSNINTELAKDDLEFFDMMMGQKTLSACRLLDEFLYSERL